MGLPLASAADEACLDAVAEITHAARPRSLAQKAWDWQNTYWKEAYRTKGRSLVAKPLDPKEREIQRKLFFFRSRPDAQPGYDFDFFGGANHLFNAPTRALTKRHVGTEYELTIPVLMVLTTPIVAPVVEAPVEAIKAVGRYDQQSTTEQTLRGSNLRAAKQRLHHELARIEQLKTSGKWSEKDLKQMHERAWDQALTDIEAIQKEYDRFYDLESDFFKRQAPASERLARLAGEPLFQSLRPLVGIDAKTPFTTLDPEKQKQLSSAINMRGHLFHAYNQIPDLLRRNDSYRRNLERPGSAKIIRQIEHDPVYLEVRRQLDEKRLSIEDAQALLMWNELWRHERFGMAITLRQPVRGSPATFKEFQSDLLAKLADGRVHQALDDNRSPSP